MSVRAYKIKKIEWEKGPSFNLWHDEEIMEVLRPEIEHQTDDDGGGLIEIPIDKLEEAILKLKGTEKSYEIKWLKEDISKAKQEGKDYIQYMCF